MGERGRWEVVNFRSTDGQLVAKRVVGLPGEVISLSEQRPVINGSIVPFPRQLEFLEYYAFGKLSRGREVSCGDGYFVLGDWSNDSADSRYDGPVPIDRIRGRAWLIVWPPSRFGFVGP